MQREQAMAVPWGRVWRGGGFVGKHEGQQRAKVARSLGGQGSSENPTERAHSVRDG